MRRGATLLLFLLASAVTINAADAGGGAVPETVAIPSGTFIAGSDRAEREAAYRLDERAEREAAYRLDERAYGHSRTREWKWYEDEGDRREVETGAYRMTRTPITNDQYLAFVRETGHRAPDVDRATWKGYGLIHPFERTRRHAWENRKPPAGRGGHPVVMVSHADARAYAAWLSAKTGRMWRLPSESEWEKAARGADGRYFPWGNEYDASRLNSHDKGSFDTVNVGTNPAGTSPYGLADAAGQVFEWTATAKGAGRYIVKGGSWDDKGCGVCRPAARHSRPQGIKHILIGFRLVAEP